MKRFLLGLIVIGASGCALIDSGTPWKSDPYMLQWIDDPNSVSLLQAFDSKLSAELIPSQVFSVGIDDHYLVVKQHPGGNKRVTNFYVVLRSQEKHDRFDPQALLGPMNADEFTARSKSMNLPLFTKTLTSLE